MHHSLFQETDISSPYLNLAQIDCLIKKLYALGLQDCEIREILLNRLL